MKQSVSEGYRPLECVQRAGDIMYVPSGWNHLTMNIGTCLLVLHEYVRSVYSVICFHHELDCTILFNVISFVFVYFSVYLMRFSVVCVSLRMCASVHFFLFSF